MVFTTAALWRRIVFGKPVKTPDSFWKKRKIFKMSAHFRFRRQNIYAFALRSVIRALTNATGSRVLKKQDTKELFETRINAACEEHGFNYPLLQQSLIRCNILLNRKMLSELAVWEPRTFKSIVDLAWVKGSKEGLNGINELGEPPSGVILKPMKPQ